MCGVEQAAREVLAALVEAKKKADDAAAALLDLARGMDAGDRGCAGVLLEVAEVVGRSEQAAHGQLVQVLAQAERVGADRAGLGTWISAHLDVTPGKAQALTRCARQIGAVPELAGPLSSGRVGADTVRALARTAQAVAGTDRDAVTELTETLAISASKGVAAANRHVRVLEHTVDPGSAEEILARQRAKSYARVSEQEGGMCRVDVLLDPARSAILRAAIDLQTAACIRERQYDKTDPLPADVRSTEQINAQSIVRLAEVFLQASPEQRGVAFSPTSLYYALLTGSEEKNIAETLYGHLVPRSVVAPPDSATASVIHVQDGQPVLLDGERIDTTPTARLASPAQRTALAFRDRHCTHPGCDRPVSWSLHAHHRVPFSKGGPTVLKNLTLLCTQHHTLAHLP